MLAFAMIVSSVLSFSYLADAQQRKTPLLGYVSATDKAADSTCAEAMRVGLGKLGYIEGQKSRSSIAMRTGSANATLSF